MRITYTDFKKGEVKVHVQTLDDLWYLSNIIDEQDIVSGQTIRKIRIGEKDERSSDVVKKKVFLKIKVEKVEFHKYSNVLRVSGTILEGPEDIPHGSYHTFNVEENTIITIQKQEWLNFQREKLKEAAEQKISRILMCVMDREDAYFALLKQFGYETLSSLKGDVTKKWDNKEVKGSFYAEIIKILQDYNIKYKLDNIIIASPAFWKEDLMKELKDPELKKKIVLATCSSCDGTAFEEVLKRQETQNVLKKDRIAKETNLVEELLTEISKESLAVYGLQDVSKAVTMGAVRILLVTDQTIQKTRENGTYKVIDNLMKSSEKIKGEVHIISSEHEAGRKLDGLGGIGGILRYKLNY